MFKLNFITHISEKNMYSYLKGLLYSDYLEKEVFV